jgi:hypothetical protein
MGTIGWIALGAVVILAVAILAAIDHIRGPATCDGCGQAKTIMMRRKIDGRWKTLCKECDPGS